MHTYIKYILMSSLLFLSVSQLTATTIIIDINGTGDYPTIQEGIDAALDGDTVLVYPGTYYENINFSGKNITVASLYLTTQDDSYIDSTVVDGNQSGSVVTLKNGETDAVLSGFTIQNGRHSTSGGGVHCYGVSVQILNCIITSNISKEAGGGIWCSYSNISLANTTIRFNHAYSRGGGIYLWENSTINFSSVNRCNIYNNYAGWGCDFCSQDVLISDIIVDTFTVLEPDEYFIQTQPENNFTLDILNGWIKPVNQDLYVSPDGNDNNSGLTPNEPLKTISFALTKIASDSTHPNTIHLAEGTYSPSATNEKFSLNMRSYVSIIGESEENTVLDGENISSNISSLINSSYGDNYFSIENLTIKNGYSYIGGGIYIRTNSSPIVKNVTFRDNFGEIGSTVYCRSNCNPIFENVKIKGNPSVILEDEPISICANSDPVFINCVIENNHINPEESGMGAIDCIGDSNPILINTKIVNNYDYETSGISVFDGSGTILINCTICDNSNCTKGVINQITHTNVTLINCILRNFAEDEIWFYPLNEPNTVTISYTNIDGGIGAINTNNNGTIHWLEGNIDEDPLFVGGEPYSYELLPGSPCIDAGTPDTTGLNLPDTDLAGNPRVVNGRIDIGAYEWQGVGIGEPDTTFTNKLYLFQNTPNPFKDETEILFITTDYERVKDYTLSIYNVKGQRIRTYNGRTNDFWVKTTITWDGTDENGREVAPGVYFYKLEYGDNAVVRKMLKVE